MIESKIGQMLKMKMSDIFLVKQPFLILTPTDTTPL